VGDGAWEASRVRAGIEIVVVESGDAVAEMETVQPGDFVPFVNVCRKSSVGRTLRVDRPRGGRDVKLSW